MSRGIHSSRRAWLIAPALALVACAAQVSTDGPLRAGGDPSEVCTVQPDQGSAVFGNVVANDSDEPLTITGASLVGAINLAIEDVRVMPIDETHSFIMGTGSTHPTVPDAIAAWDSAEQLNNHELGAGQEMNIVLAVVNGTSETGTSRAVRFEYEQGARKFTAETNMALELADDDC